MIIRKVWSSLRIHYTPGKTWNQHILYILFTSNKALYMMRNLVERKSIARRALVGESASAELLRTYTWYGVLINAKNRNGL